MNESTKLARSLPPPLPGDRNAWETKRANRLTLNDYVESLHLELQKNDTYKAYLYAVYDEQAVEGSLSCDNTKAAEMIRDLAKQRGNSEVSKEKLATISKSLGVVLRRFCESRKERRNMIHGEVQPDMNNSD